LQRHYEVMTEKNDERKLMKKIGGEECGGSRRGNPTFDEGVEDSTLGDRRQSEAQALRGKVLLFIYLFCLLLGVLFVVVI
jgi:hypothetical protein